MFNATRFRPHRKAVATLFVAAIALAACGGDAEPAETADAATDAAAGGSVDFSEIQQSFGADGELTITFEGGEPVVHEGPCDMWTDDVSVYVDFIGAEADMNMHQLTTDDPNVAWSGPSAFGFTTLDGVEYSLDPADLSFPSANVAAGTAMAAPTATDAAATVTPVSWSLTCG